MNVGAWWCGTKGSYLVVPVQINDKSWTEMVFYVEVNRYGFADNDFWGFWLANMHSAVLGAFMFTSEGTRLKEKNQQIP